MTAFSPLALCAALFLQGAAARHRHCPPARALAIVGSLLLQSEVLFTVEGRPSPGPLPAPPPPPPPSPPPPLPPPSTDNNCTQLIPVSEVTEGPYWIEENILATNVRRNLSYGVPLNLTIKVSNGTLSAAQGLCVPIEQARVDLWQSRYDGLYSDEEDVQGSTIGETWLRGYQYSNSTGHASFLTIIPGWYVSRTPHIHIRVRIYKTDDNTTLYDDTTQLFFNNTITTAIYTSVYPYNNRGLAKQDTFNNNDSLFRSANLLTLMGSYKKTYGYSSLVEVKLPFDDGNKKSGGGIMASS